MLEHVDKQDLIQGVCCNDSAGWPIGEQTLPDRLGMAVIRWSIGR